MLINCYAPNDETQKVKVLTEISNYIDTLEVIVKNDPVLKMTLENKTKTFRN